MWILPRILDFKEWTREGSDGFEQNYFCMPNKIEFMKTHYSGITRRVPYLERHWDQKFRRKQRNKTVHSFDRKLCQDTPIAKYTFVFNQVLDLNIIENFALLDFTRKQTT